MSGIRCSRCQRESPDAASFCWGCGARLAGSDVRGAVPQQLDSFGNFTDTLQSTFEGEHKQITVLFADMKSSMELIADRDPEEAYKLLDPVLERMMQSVQFYDGTISSINGDGIMALFRSAVRA